MVPPYIVKGQSELFLLQGEPVSLLYCMRAAILGNQRTLALHCLFLLLFTWTMLCVHLHCKQFKKKHGC